MNNIVTGNATLDGKDTKGWFIGSFVTSDNTLRKNDSIEVKWVNRVAGEEHVSNAEGDITTLAILVRGEQRVIFEDKEVVLKNEGDYVMWSPHISHKTVAVKDSVIIVIRWKT